MRTIFKYPLVGETIISDGRFEVEVEMPESVRCLRVAIIERPGVRPVPTLWAEVTPSKELKKYRFWFIGTGREVPVGQYVGTVEMGSLVWHIYGPEAIE